MRRSPDCTGREKIGQLNLQALQAYQAKVGHENPDNATLADQVKHRRMQTTHTGELVKLWLKVEPQELEQVAVNSLVQLGGKHKHGVPPRSHNSRRLQVHLDGLDAQTH